MKTKALFAALLVLTCLVAASCQKEPAPEPQPTTLDAVVAYTVSYSIDGQSNTMVVNGEGELTAFLRYLNMQARHGHSVEMALEGVEGSATATKDSQTITGASESEILAWETARLREGYRVTITFDADNGTYSGVAIRSQLDPEILSSLVGTSWTCHLDDVFYVVGWGTVRSILDHTYVFETDSTGMRYSQTLDENNNPVGNPYVFSLTYNYNSETLLCDIVDGGAGDSLQYYYDRQMNALVPTSGSDRIYYRDSPRTDGAK